MNPQPKGDTTEPTTKTFTFDLLDDPRYLVIQHQGYRLLLDTGSPLTIWLPGGPQGLDMLGGHVRFMKMPFPKTYLENGFNILGLKVDGIVGMNVLGQFAWEVNRTAGTVQATTVSPEAGGTVWLPMDAKDGPPIVTLDDGARVILDSGAALSYRVGGSLPGGRPAESETVWSILFGTIRTPVWEADLRLGGMGFTVHYGKLPTEVAGNLAWMETGWIVSASLYRAFRVFLDFPNGRLGLQPLESNPGQEDACG